MNALELATAVAPHLTGHWVALTIRETLDHIATLHRPADDVRLTIRLGGYDKRGHCTPQEQPVFDDQKIPDLHGSGTLAANEKRPKASFDPNRPPKAIATQIDRAVLWPYMAIRPTYLAKTDRTLASRAELRSAVDDICATLGTTESDWNKTPTKSRIGIPHQPEGAFGHFALTAYGDGMVAVELHHMTFDDARALAAWIAGRNKPLGVK